MRGESVFTPSCGRQNPGVAYRGTVFEERKVKGTAVFVGGSVTAWACFSNDSQLEMHVINGKYRDEILRAYVVPNFETHTLANRPLYMDNNARPPRA